MEKWLKKIRMSKYKQSFQDNGYETADLCASLSKEDLDAIGVSNEHHRSTLFTQAKKLRELVESSCKVVDSADAQPPAPLAAASNDKLQQLVTRSSSAEEESQHVLKNRNSRNRLSMGASSIQANLTDYSEPWNGASTSTNDTTHTTKAKQIKRVHSSTPTNTADGFVNSRRSVVHKKPPLSPVLADSATKKDSNTGMTRLQLKLKIREELFIKHVMLSEQPYCRLVSNGSSSR